MTSQRQPKSPWQRKGKQRFIYSPTYQHWREVVKEKGACHPDALALACQHAKAFHYRHNLPTGQKADDCSVNRQTI